MMRRGVVGAGLLLACASPALAQEEPVVTGLWPLFRQSFDFFSVLLILASMLAVGVIARCVIDLRRSVILPDTSVGRLEELADTGRFEELSSFAGRDRSFVSLIVAAGLKGTARGSMRERAEVVASEQCARWFHRMEPLNVIGNLGPLLGLAGTVWGMILAFNALGASGGQANPGALSLGISKALFHTLLGLLLALPCLAVYGFYRSRLDSMLNEGMTVASGLIERLADWRERGGDSRRAETGRADVA
ncbi:MAG: MotA/TolQ/ExbB proton channel family protein [Phycisphaeraceae bacterium]|nr:MotA/TolQ/ExbB proton channel family protein [Phycisphaeraceae bacterium]